MKFALCVMPGAARTGLSEADATARKTGIAFALMAALSLVIGAFFIASATAALGGRLRDE